MFGFLKNSNGELSAPQTGIAVPIADVPDDVFAGKILGDGVGIKPTEDGVYSPVDGTVIQIAHTFHAFGIQSNDGLEILVHLGINTVELNGEGFNCHAIVGQKVKKGDKIMDMDRAFIESKGYNTISPCIITNMDDIVKFDTNIGEVKGGETVVITYKKK